MALMCLCAAPFAASSVEHEKPNTASIVKQLVKDPNYRWYMLGIFSYFFAIYIPFAHIGYYCLTIGLTFKNAYELLAILAGSSMVGRMITGVAASKFGSLWLYRVNFFIATLMSFVWIACDTYDTMVVFAVFYGFAYGSILTLHTRPNTGVWITLVRRMVC